MNMITQSLIDGFNENMAAALRYAFLCERARNRGNCHRAFSFYGYALEFYGRAMGLYSRLGSHDRELLQANYRHVSNENFLSIMERNRVVISASITGNEQ